MFVTGGHGVPRSSERVEMTREEMAAAIEAAHLRGAMVRGHIANRDAILMAVELGMDVIDHGDGMDGQCIDRIVAAGTFVVPSMFFLFRYAEMLKDQSPAVAQGMQEELDAALAVLPVAQEAGVKLVLGDDYGAAGFPHGIYGEEIEFYVKVAGICLLYTSRAPVAGLAQNRGEGLATDDVDGAGPPLAVEGPARGGGQVLAVDDRRRPQGGEEVVGLEASGGGRHPVPEGGQEGHGHGPDASARTGHEDLVLLVVGGGAEAAALEGQDAEHGGEPGGADSLSLIHI